MSIKQILESGPGDSVIQACVGKWEIEYEAASELDSASSAYSAIFWDKRSNWIVVAFKGTSPPEFDGEWSSVGKLALISCRMAGGFRLHACAN